MVDHPFTDKHALVRLSLSFPAHLFALITQEALRNRERVYWTGAIKCDASLGRCITGTRVI